MEISPGEAPLRGEVLVADVAWPAAMVALPDDGLLYGAAPHRSDRAFGRAALPPDVITVLPPQVIKHPNVDILTEHLTYGLGHAPKTVQRPEELSS